MSDACLVIRLQFYNSIGDSYEVFLKDKYLFYHFLIIFSCYICQSLIPHANHLNHCLIVLTTKIKAGQINNGLVLLVWISAIGF